MKISELKKLLASKGAHFVEGSKHTKVYLNGKQTVLSRGSGELPEGTRLNILKQLGLK